VANIQTRKTRDGTTSYRVQIRLQGFPPQTATFSRRTDAKQWATQTEAALREGRYFPTQEAKRHTLNDLAARYLENVERRKPQAHRKQKQIMQWWQDRLGDYSLSAITPAMVAEKRDELLTENIGTDKEPRRRSPATANRYLAALSKAMSDAVREWHWLNENPVKRVTKETEPQGRVRYLSDDERAALLKACQESPLKPLELIVLLAITTGMRKGEILGLRWPDVDLKRRIAVLHKTKNSERRAAPLVPRVAELLQEHAKVRRLDTDLVFARAGNDGPLEIKHRFEEALAKAKIENFRFHDLRHTAASYLAMSGATPPEIAAVLGHKTLAMVKRYAHLSDAHTGAVVERMAAKYFGNAA
jgi:integrase